MAHSISAHLSPYHSPTVCHPALLQFATSNIQQTIIRHHVHVHQLQGLRCESKKRKRENQSAQLNPTLLFLSLSLFPLVA